MLLCYTALGGVTSMSVVTVEFLDQNERVKAILHYFVCEAAGAGSECDTSGFDTLGAKFLFFFNAVWLGLLAIVNLIFVVNWTAVKKSCHHFQMQWSGQSNHS